MLSVRLAGDDLYGKKLFTWLLLVMSLMVSFCAAFFPRDVSDEIWDLIESVSEGFLIHSFIQSYMSSCGSMLVLKCKLHYFSVVYYTAFQ